MIVVHIEERLNDFSDGFEMRLYTGVFVFFFATKEEMTALAFKIKIFECSK